MTPCKSDRKISFSFECPLIVVLIIFFLLLNACGESRTTSDLSESETQVTGSGSAAVSLRWYSRSLVAGTGQGPYTVKAIADCEQEGVTQIQCNVYEESDNLLVEGEVWECADRHGTLDGIPPGNDRVFVCMGLGNDNIVHLGQISGITIQQGKTTVIKTPIDFYPFFTQLNAPEEGAQVSANRFDLTWNSVPNAHQYLVQIAEDNRFENSVEIETTTRTSLTPSLLLPARTYFWKVAPVDQHGNQGLDSAVRSFVTLPGAECRSPRLAPLANLTVNTGETVTISLNATDPDPGDQLTFSAEPLPSGAQLDPNTGLFTWPTTPVDVGSHRITFSVCDNCVDGPLCSSEDVTIIVGDSAGTACQPPELNEIGSLSATEGTRLSVTLNAADTDTPAPQLQYHAYDIPQGAVFEGRTFTWTPPAGSAGNYTVRFQVCDDCTPTPFCDEESVPITVTAETHTEIVPPVLSNPVDNATLDNGCDNGRNPIEWNFSWLQADGADRYEIAILQGQRLVIDRIVRSAEFSYRCNENSEEIRNCVISGDNAGTWSWQVRAGYSLVDSIQWSDWSQLRRFGLELPNTDCMEAVCPPQPTIRITLDQSSYEVIAGNPLNIPIRLSDADYRISPTYHVTLDNRIDLTRSFDTQRRTLRWIPSDNYVGNHRIEFEACFACPEAVHCATAAAAIHVTSPQPQLPDIVPVDFRSPTRLTPGGIAGANLSLNARNASSVPCESATGYFFVGFYISTDQRLDGADRLLRGGRESVTTPMDPNETRAVTIFDGMTIPEDIAAGNYYLLAVVDEFNAVAEANEGNNVAANPITITPLN